MNKVHLIGQLGNVVPVTNSTGNPTGYANFLLDVDDNTGYGRSVGVLIRVPPDMWSAWQGVSETPPYGGLRVSVEGHMSLFAPKPGEGTSVGVVADLLEVLAPSNWAKKFEVYLDPARNARHKAPADVTSMQAQVQRYYEEREKAKQQAIDNAAAVRTAEEASRKAVSEAQTYAKELEAQREEVKRLEDLLLYERAIAANFGPSGA